MLFVTLSFKTFSVIFFSIVLKHSRLFFQYLQYYVERADRLSWYSDHCFQHQVDVERDRRTSTETMLRFLSHEGMHTSCFQLFIPHPCLRDSHFISFTVRNPQNAIALSVELLLVEAREKPTLFLPAHIQILQIIHSSSEFISSMLEGMAVKRNSYFGCAEKFSYISRSMS